MQAAKKMLTVGQKELIRKLSGTGRSIKEIAEDLDVDPRQVSGYVRTVINADRIPPMMGPRAMPVPTQEDLLKDLAKKWRDSEPREEFSMQTEKGQKVYIAAYKGGIVLRVGDQKKVALLTSNMGQRLGNKLGEMATWSRFP